MQATASHKPAHYVLSVGGVGLSLFWLSSPTASSATAHRKFRKGGPPVANSAKVSRSSVPPSKRER